MIQSMRMAEGRKLPCWDRVVVVFPGTPPGRTVFRPSLQRHLPPRPATPGLAGRECPGSWLQGVGSWVCFLGSLSGRVWQGLL